MEITLEGEKGVLTWDGAGVGIEGYSLEDETIALALNGNIGKGLGVLLKAIDDIKVNKDLRQTLNRFKRNMASLEAGEAVSAEWEWPKDDLFYQYLTYSPDPERRWAGAMKCLPTIPTIKRILYDKEEGVVLALAARRDLKAETYEQLATSKSARIRRFLVVNIAIPIHVLRALAHDEDVSIRMMVPRTGRCTIDIFKDLLLDPEDKVVYQALDRSDFPKDLKIQIAQDGEIYQRIYLAKWSQDEDVLNILLQSKNEKIQKVLGQNRFFREREMIKARKPNQGLGI